ncbi:uncharacterized protein [Dendrobates tinctorius]|uniref:uncharacterized protein n=1 Tax=Dendrobates tinctorius TaxID=92724 RepID=UPI003CC9F112
MGAHIAERSLLLGCLVALAIPAHSLKCHTCVGSDNVCSPIEVTCPGDNDKCSTTALYVDSFPCKVQKVFKGCINSTTSSQKISISPNERITLSMQQKFCDSDLCNTKEIPGPNKTQNDLYCHSCISPETTCNSDTMKTMRCMGEQKQCVDMKVVGSFGDIADVNLKGCGEIPSCTQKLAFSSQTSSVSVQCCNENFCNSGTDSGSEDKTPNGLQCYSCNTLDGSSCSTESVVKAQCYGALTSCLEIEGTFVKDGQTLPTVIKGCATPSICDVPILPLLQKLGTPTVKCCNGSLCNSQYSESGLQASGYLPVGNTSPGTGIQNQPSTDATSGGNPVKTEQHAVTNYGTGSHNNNGYTKHYFNSYEGLSNSGSVYGPNIPTQVHQGTTYNGLSVGNPNLVFGSNNFPNGDETTDNDSILIDNESNTVSSPINYSPGQTYDSMLSPGSSVVLNPNYSINDGSSIPDAPPTFPDFTSYGEDIFFPNSNSDNGMNFPYNNEYNSYDNGGFTEIAYTDIDFPNSNDFSNYESAGFTDVVYTDLDWNEDPSNSPTVAPDSAGPNSHDSIGSSAYNPNAILSANNNETGGYSANTANIDSNVNVQGNNVNVQNLTSTTPMTHNSDINLHISGYVTNIYNMDTGNNNASRNNISSPIHYSSGENNLSVLSPGPSTVGREDAPNSNYSNSDGSSILDTPPTFPDFVNYEEDSFFPSANADNDINFPYNNENNSYDNGGFTEIAYTDIDFPNSDDFGNYESAGFTDVVYTDLGSNEDPSNSPTVAPNSVGPNSHDSIGSSASNPNDILLVSNETGGYSTNTVNNGSNGNIPRNNSNMQNLTSTTPKPHNYDSNEQMSTYGNNIHNFGTANNNSSENNISSPIHYSSGENNLSVSSTGSSALGGDVLANINNNSTSDGSSIPDANPTFPDFSNYGEDSFFSNSNFDNMNFPDNNEYNSYDNGGFTEIAYTDIDFPNSNDFGNYESAGFTDVVYTDLDWNEDPSNSPTMTPDSVGPNSHDSIGNSASNPNYILLVSNETGGYSTNTVNNGSNVNVQGNSSVQNLTSTTPKPHNFDSNQQISGYGTNMHNIDTSNNNGSESNVSSPIHYSSGQSNLSLSSTGSSTLGGYVLSNYNDSSTSDDSSILDAPPTFPDFSNYGEDNFFPNSNSDNDMNFPYNNEYNSYDNGGFTEIAYTDVDFPNSNDFSNYESAGFTDVVYTDLDWNNNQFNSPTVAPGSEGPNSHDSVGNPGGDTSNAYKPNTILLASNETNGYSSNAVNVGSNVNITGNSSNVQNLNLTTPKPHNSDSNQQISGYGTNTNNIDTDNNNGSENNISSVIHYSSEGNYVSVSGSSTLGGDVLSNYNNNSTSDGSSIPDAPPTFPDFSNYGEDSFYPNSNSDNDVNFPNNNEYSSYDNGGFTEIAYTDVNFPNSNDFGAGFTDVVYPTVDWNEDPSNSPTVATSSVGPNNHDIVGNSGSDTSSSYNLNTIPLTGNNDTGGHSADTVKTKTHNSGIKKHISGHGANIYNMDISNNNGSGNYISSSGNNTAGSGNSSIAGSSGSSSLAYINSGNGTGITNEWNNSNNYSHHNNAIPVGYTNIHGNSYSSPINSSSSNGTQINFAWLDTVVYYNSGDNDSSVSYAGLGGMNGWSNSSNSNMTEHVGYINIPGNNSSTTSYTSTGNGTGIANDFSNSNNSKPNISVLGGYTNMSGSNDSSTSYGSSGNWTGIINSNGSNHSMGVPEGYANVPGGNGSSTSYASPGHGTEFSNDNSSSNYSMLVPGANGNFPGSNDSSTSYTSSSNGTGMTNEWINSNGSYHNMASPGGNYGSFNSNGSSHFSDSNHSSNFMIPNNGPPSGNGSNYGGPWDSMESYLNHISSWENNNGSHPNISSWMHEFVPGGSSYSNKTGWIFGSNYDPNMMNSNNDSSSYYNNIQNFLSKLNGSIHSNDSQKINEWIQNNSFFSYLMPPSINNGSGYNVNSMFNRSLSDYFKSLGISWNNSNIPNIPSMFPSGNNEPFNISNIGSGWSNIMYNPNVKNPHANSTGPIPYNIGSYGNIQIPNFISPGSPNNGSTNTNGMIPGGYSNGYNNGNEHGSYVIPSGGSNPGAGNNMGHENINNGSHNSNMMVPGVGSGGSSNGGASADGNVYNTNLSGHNTDVLIPGRSTNDSTSDGASNGSGSKNGTTFNSATTVWTKSGHFVIFSALALLVLN